jgi:arsenate reductase
MNLFSKDLDHPGLPKKNFGAVLVCVNDAEACPFIPHAEVRIPLPYADPKKFDGTGEMEAAYDRCCLQIASEMMWVMEVLTSA